MFNKSVIPLVIVFLITAALIFIFRQFLESHGFDRQVLNGGNLFIFLVTAVSMYMLTKGMNAPDTNAFFRNAMGVF